MKRLSWLLCACAALVLTGCENAVTKAVNTALPPVNIDQQRQEAIASTAKALSAMQGPNVALGVDFDDANATLFTEALRKEGVTALSVTGDEQLLIVKASFKRTFSAKDAGDDAALKAALGAATPTIAGSVEVYTGISGSVTAEKDSPKLDLRILPGVSRVAVDKVEIAGVDATKITDPIVKLLNRYRDNITGELTRAPFARYSVPAVAPETLDLAKMLQPKKQDPNVKVTVTGNPVDVDAHWDGVAWLITSDQLTGVLQISSKVGPKPKDALAIEPTYGGIRGQFDGIVQDSFGLTSLPSKTWVAVRRDLLAFTVNDALSKAQLCASFEANTKTKADKKIPMPGPEGISCSMDMTCNGSQSCSWDASKDTRNCHRCLIYSPQICAFGRCVGGGGCITEGNDPICEAAKAAQNLYYANEANVRKAACDARNTAEIGACQIEKNGRKALCDAGKEALTALRKTGNLANFSAEATIKSEGAQVCLRQFNLGGNLESLNLAIEVQGKAKADVDIEFIPLDLGHAICQFPVKKSQPFTAELRESLLSTAADVKLVTNKEGQAFLDYTTAETKVKARLSPGPTEFLLKSPEIAFKCPIVGLLAPLVVVATPFVPELRGEIDHTIAKEQRSLELPLPKPDVEGGKMKLEPLVTAKAIGVYGKFEAAKK